MSIGNYPISLRIKNGKKLQSDLLIGEGPKECFEKCSSAKWNFNHATEW